MITLISGFTLLCFFTYYFHILQTDARVVGSNFQAITLIGKEEGMKGYWKGNLPQVIRVLPYSAVQLLAYETYKVSSLCHHDELMSFSES